MNLFNHAERYIDGCGDSTAQEGVVIQNRRIFIFVTTLACFPVQYSPQVFTVYVQTGHCIQRPQELKSVPPLNHTSSSKRAISPRPTRNDFNANLLNAIPTPTEHRSHLLSASLLDYSQLGVGIHHTVHQAWRRGERHRACDPDIARKPHKQANAWGK